MADLERTGRLKQWQKNPQKIVKNRVNIRRLKMQVKRKQEQDGCSAGLNESHARTIPEDFQ